MKTNLRIEHYEAKNLDSFWLPIEKYSNLQTGDEVDLDGKRYDLMQVQKEGAFYHVIAFNDKKEKALLINLGYNIQRSSEDVPIPPLSISKVKWVCLRIKVSKNQAYLDGSKLPLIFSLPIISRSSDIPTPPPKVLV